MESGKVVMLIILLTLVAAVYYFHRKVSPESLELRPIAGLEALSEVVGRSTETGRPLHYTFGAGEMDADVLASFEVLKHVASLSARMKADMFVTVTHADQHPIAEQIVRHQYEVDEAGDQFDPTKVLFLGGHQQAYQSGALALIEREKVAANVLIGSFKAEALTVAEFGNLAGAMQIAGTNQILQIPFFVAACDYVLIGEELFAASAYLGKDRARLAYLLAQECGKISALVLMLIGSILTTVGVGSLHEWLSK